jgi:hypothetical protein
VLSTQVRTVSEPTPLSKSIPSPLPSSEPTPLTKFRAHAAGHIGFIAASRRKRKPSAATRAEQAPSISGRSAATRSPTDTAPAPWLDAATPLYAAAPAAGCYDRPTLLTRRRQFTHSLRRQRRGDAALRRGSDGGMLRPPGTAHAAPAGYAFAAPPKDAATLLCAAAPTAGRIDHPALLTRRRQIMYSPRRQRRGDAALRRGSNGGTLRLPDTTATRREEPRAHPCP